LRDHLAECDECRDFRHEARDVADLVARAGQDFVAATDLEAKLIERIAERSPGSIESVPKTIASAPAAKKAPADSAKVGGRVDPAPLIRRRRVLSSLASLKVAAVALAAIAIPMARTMRTPAVPGTVHAPAGGTPWHGTITFVARADADPN